MSVAEPAAGRTGGGKSGPAAGAVTSVPKALAGTRLDVCAFELFAELPSRKSAYRLSKSGEVLLDGVPAPPHTRVCPGQRLTLARAAPAPTPVLELRIEVVFEDDVVAVVVKPPGLSVSGNVPRTVVRALPANLRSSGEADALDWPHPVHRLDRPTGGLLLVAKTASAQVALGHQFEERSVRKRYRAVVVGRLPGAGTFDTPIDGRDAVTDYRAAETTRSLTYGWVTLVDLFPRTGRTHQLRRHLAGAGHPVIGDPAYSGSFNVLRGKGLFLWAVGLRWRHPVASSWMEVDIPTPAKFDTYRARERRRWHAFMNGPRARP